MRVSVYSRWLGVTGLIVAVSVGGPASAEAQQPKDAPRPAAPAPASAPPSGSATPAGNPPSHGSSASDSMSEDARTHYRLGHAYYESGRFDLAIAELRRAYDLSKDPHMLYDLFLAYRDAGELGQAIDALERYLKQTPDAPDHEALQQRLDTMKRLQEQKATGEQEQGAGKQRASKSGSGQGRSPAGGPEHGSTEPGGAPSGGAAGRPKGSGSAGAVPQERTHAAAPWIVMGIGGALLAGGAVTGVLALRLEKDLEKRCPNHACPPGVSFEADTTRGQKLATATDVLLGTGLFTVAAAVAMKLMLGANTTERAPTRPQSPIASVGCGPHGCMGEVRVQF